VTSQAELVKAQIRIAATPEEIFPYLIESDLMVQWIGTRVDLHPEPGGEFALDFDDTSLRGTFVIVDPPHRVVFTWGVPGSEELPAGSSTVEITLTADGDGTLVELTHADLPPDERPKHEAGWNQLLPVLREKATA
jgi:uncharacterized protein YndB with AHSA1/START domain